MPDDKSAAQTAEPDATLTTTFKHESEEITLTGLSDCSITRHIQTTGTFYEGDFLGSLSTYVDPSKWAVDVGAHVGNHAIYIAKIMGMRVLAFEPNPKAFTVLKANAAQNGVANEVSVLNAAVSDSPGQVNLFTRTGVDPGTFSMLGRRGDDVESVSCKAVRLDDYMEFFEARPPGFIKIDVEGADLKVLEGAEKVIDRYRPVIALEVLDPDMLARLKDILVPRGYRPVSVHNASPTILWTTDATKGNPVKELMSILNYGVNAAYQSNLAQIKTRGLQLRVKDLEDAAAEAADSLGTASEPSSEA